MLAKRIQNLHPYVPGEQPKDREYIKLNANENPYPPHESVAEALSKAALASTAKIGLYPDPDSNELRSAIADMLNSTGGVFCTSEKKKKKCTFFDGDRPLVMPEFTYSFYPVYCGYYGIPMCTVPLKADWQLDRDAMLSAANKTDSAIIFANPNAPTGISIPRDEVRKMIEKAPKDKVFIVDEAYCDFGGESCIPLLAEFKNLVIVRTFSKSLSFAGMRLGYVVASPELVKSIFMVKNSFNHFPVDFMAQTAGIASCKAAYYYAENSRKIVQQRESFTKFLRDHGFFVIDSKTNFVFAKKDGLTGDAIYQAVKKEGILIRHFSTKGIEDFVRITIGTEEQMNALKKIMGNL